MFQIGDVVGIPKREQREPGDECARGLVVGVLAEAGPYNPGYVVLWFDLGEQLEAQAHHLERIDV